MRTLPRRLSLAPLALLAPLAVVAAVLSSCHGVHPLEIAESCRCSPREYCHVRPASRAGEPRPSTVECLPLPSQCHDPPSCACLGRPVDACREELGAFTVIEPRAVNACGECATEEYCWLGETPAPAQSHGPPLCRLLPARCETTPTCACLQEARQLRPLACTEQSGRIELSLVP